MKFHPESKSLISAFPDQLRSYSLANLNAPPTCFESEWGTNLLDLQIPQNKLLGISAEGAAVSVWVGSLKKKDEKPDAANKVRQVKFTLYSFSYRFLEFVLVSVSAYGL